MSPEYYRRGRNWYTAMGTLFIIMALIVLVRQLILWGPEFVLSLLESKGVLAVHGSGFGEKYGSEHFRLVFLPNIETLASALDKIEEFVSQ